jgi:hypothetical protein
MAEPADGFQLPSDCRREIQSLFAYWDGKREGRRCPARADLDPADIPRLLRHIFLIDVLPDEFGLRYRVFGTALVQLFKRDLTGRPVGTGLQPEQVPAVRARYARIVREGTPFFERARMHETKNDHTEVERLILPLSNDGTRIGQLIGMTIPRYTRDRARALPRL